MSESFLSAFQNLEFLCFYISFTAFAMWEYKAPLRLVNYSIRLRWLNNLGIFILNTVLIRLFSPILTVAFAVEIQQSGWGFFNLLDLPDWFTVIVSFVLLDFFFYLKHRIAHNVPWFWRFHRVHHSDGDFDLSTSFRFHPLDVAYQTILQMFAVLVIGAPPLAVAAYAIVFMVVARLQHSNIRIPKAIDSKLRHLVVTADMHRIHHSSMKLETNSNYGGVLPWHDKLLGTYTHEPEGGQIGMQVGLDEFREKKHMTLGWMLLNPFLSKAYVSDVSEQKKPPLTGTQTRLVGSMDKI